MMEPASWNLNSNPPGSERLACQHYLVAADEPRREERLLCANELLPLLELGGQLLHLLLLLLLLSQQLLALAAGRRQPLLRRPQAEGEKLLTVQEPLHRELSQAQELDERRVHGALATLASLALEGAEGDGADVVLQGFHVQLAHYKVHVHGVDAPPVHARRARTELEREYRGSAAGWCHAWRRRGVSVC